jgi:hypothetical protein
MAKAAAHQPWRSSAWRNGSSGGMAWRNNNGMAAAAGKRQSNGKTAKWRISGVGESGIMAKEENQKT